MGELILHIKKKCVRETGLYQNRRRGETCPEKDQESTLNRMTTGIGCNTGSGGMHWLKFLKKWTPSEIVVLTKAGYEMRTREIIGWLTLQKDRHHSRDSGEFSNAPINQRQAEKANYRKSLSKIGPLGCPSNFIGNRISVSGWKYRKRSGRQPTKKTILGNVDTLLEIVVEKALSSIAQYIILIYTR